VDPLQALRDAAAHLAASELAEAKASLDAYRRWRANGGFEPAGGDALARLLEQQLHLRTGSRRCRDEEPRLLGQCLDEMIEQREWARGLRRRDNGDR
jgi:hypothetical protein